MTTAQPPSPYRDECHDGDAVQFRSTEVWPGYEIDIRRRLLGWRDHRWIRAISAFVCRRFGHRYSVSGADRFGNPCFVDEICGRCGYVRWMNSFRAPNGDRDFVEIRHSPPVNRQLVIEAVTPILIGAALGLAAAIIYDRIRSNGKQGRP